MYALINRDLTQVLKTRAKVTPIPKENLAPNKPYWVPLVTEVDDQSTHEWTQKSTNDVIEVDQVRRVTTITNAPKPDFSQISKLELYYQAKAENLWTTFQSILDANPDAKAEWELASYLDINRPTVKAIGTAMGLDAAALQTFFNNAKGRES